MPRPRASSRCASEVTSPLTPARSKPGPRSCTLISMRSGNSEKVMSTGFVASRLWPCWMAFVPASITDIVICEHVSSSIEARSHTVWATRSSSASNSRRLGKRTDMTSGDGLFSGMWCSTLEALDVRLELVQGSREIRRNGGYESKSLAGHRMDQLQLRGVQGLPRQPVEQGRCEATLRNARAQLLFRTPSVHRVPDHGQPQVGEVDADLVGAPGIEAHLEL